MITKTVLLVSIVVIIFSLSFASYTPMVEIDEHLAEVAELHAQIDADKATIEDLRKQIEDLRASITVSDKKVTAIVAKAPVPEKVKTAVQQAAQTDSGLVHESLRVLGDLGLTRLEVTE